MSSDYSPLTPGALFFRPPSADDLDAIYSIEVRSLEGGNTVQNGAQLLGAPTATSCSCEATFTFAFTLHANHYW